jgi:SAM-dependent methyltransferase
MDRLCPICESAEFKVLFQAGDRLYRTTRRRFSLVECGSCHAAYLSPTPSPSDLAGFYPFEYWVSSDRAGGLANAYRRAVLRDRLRFVRRSLEESGETGPVVDIGCGGGLFLSLLRKWRPRSAGLDVSPEACSVAWRGYGAPAACGSLFQAPFREASCAAVTMFHVLEHVHDPKRAIEAARGLLRPRGRLVVQVPNADSWQRRLLGKRWIGFDIPRHLVTFRAANLARLLESCGFQVLRRKHFSLRDNPAGFVSSLFPSLDPAVRRARGAAERRAARLLKDCAYFLLVVLAAPFALLEAACRAGATVMVEARKR